MWSIQNPNLDLRDSLTGIVSRKKASPDKQLLQSSLELLVDRYLDYVAHSPRLEGFPRLLVSQTLRTALKKCYEGTSRFKRELSESLDIVNRPRLCAYCQLKHADTWDHYLPSSLYPDLYVHPFNLVRVCHGCNEAKGDRRVTPTRQTVHPYFDKLEFNYLKCTVVYDLDFQVSFSIDPDTSASGYCSYTHSIVSAHFEEYGLSRQFRAEASALVEDIRTNMAKIAEQRIIEQSDIDTEYWHERRKHQNRLGEFNNWKIAFLDGFHSCPGLVNHLNTDTRIKMLSERDNVRTVG